MTDKKFRSLRELFKEAYRRHVLPSPHIGMAESMVKNIKRVIQESSDKVDTLKQCSDLLSKLNSTASLRKILDLVNEDANKEEAKFKPRDPFTEPPPRKRRTSRPPRDLIVILLSVLEKEKGPVDSVKKLLVEGGELDQWISEQGFPGRRLVPTVYPMKKDWRKGYRQNLWRALLAGDRVSKRLSDDDRAYKKIWTYYLNDKPVQEIVRELVKYDQDVDYIFEGAFPILKKMILTDGRKTTSQKTQRHRL